MKNLRTLCCVKTIKTKTPYNYYYYWHEAVLDSDDLGANDNVPRYRQHKLIPLSSRDTLAEAYWALKEQRAGAVYVFDKQQDNILGLITFEQIRQYLLEGKLHS